VIRADPKPISPRKRKAKRTSQRTYCDTLWSLYIRKRANGKCQRCGLAAPLQAAHIIPRRVLTTRWHLNNGVGLCPPCHRDLDNPASALTRLTLIRDWIGEKGYEELLKMARERWDRDYARVLKELKSA
jgi:5-methylcytosine-specific restriction endonuclease McrA